MSCIISRPCSKVNRKTAACLSYTSAGQPSVIVSAVNATNYIMIPAQARKKSRNKRCISSDDCRDWLPKLLHGTFIVSFPFESGVGSNLASSQPLCDTPYSTTPYQHSHTPSFPPPWHLPPLFERNHFFTSLDNPTHHLQSFAHFRAPL